jgi:hypothetical protein
VVSGLPVLTEFSVAVESEKEFLEGGFAAQEFAHVASGQNLQ